MSVTSAQRRMPELSGRHFIGGQAIAGTGPHRDIVDPATENVIGAYAEASADEVDRAVAASRGAQKV
jgi:acyl-CoA reductase-like NAD-dependent aldehyde dehydrogenase